MGNEHTSDRLLSELEMRNWVMEIADHLIPTLKDRRIDEDGNQPRFISVHDLEIDYRYTSEVHQFKTTVHYLSDIGDFEEDLIIRYFESIYYYTLERTQYERLSARTKVFDHIEPVELLFQDEAEQTLVYSAPVGVALEDLGLSEELYYFQLGILLGMLHSGETSKLNPQPYQAMSDYLLLHLPFDDMTKQLIKEGLKSEFEIIEDSYAGYEPLTQIELSHIRFTPLEDIITKSKILSGEAIYIEILPSLMTELQMDRMEDIATIFAKMGFEEFDTTGQVHKTRDLLFYTMEGYEGYFDQYSHAPMDTIYPKGLSLDLHMILAIWLFGFNRVQNNDIFDITTLGKYSLYVLNMNPFQIYG